MKFLHTSDWHLGKVIYGRSLLADQEYFICRGLLPLIEQEQPDLIVLSGDVFDRQIAPVEAILLFDKFIYELHRMRIPLAVISGNHDSAERMTLGAELLRQDGVYIVTTLEEAMRPVPLGNGADLYLLPYFDPAQARAFLGDDSLRGFNEAYAAVIGKMKETFLADTAHFLAAHCFVMGSALSASESPTFVGGSSEVSAENFAGFAYVALGHLHGPQRAGVNGRYCGSPLKYSFDETSQKKSVTLVEYHDYKIETTQIPIEPLHDMRVLTGCFEEILQKAKDSPSEDYLYLNLMDGHPVYMPMDRLRPYYPNLLGIQADWLAHAGNGENAALREQLMHRKTDDTAIFEEFLKQICGTQATEEDRELFSQALCQTGEVEE